MCSGKLYNLAASMLIILFFFSASAHAESKNHNSLLMICTTAYKQQTLIVADKICKKEKQKANNNNDSIQSVAITRVLININKALANHAIIEKLFQDAKALITSELEHHKIMRDHGIYYYHLGDYKNAETHFIEALELARKMAVPKLIAKSLNDVGLIHLRNLNYKAALIYLRESLEIKESLNLDHHSGVTIRNIALVYYRMNDNKKALKFYLMALQKYKKALQLKPDNLTLRKLITHINTDLAAVYSRLGHNERSKKALNNVYLAIAGLDDKSKTSRLVDLAEGLIEGKDYKIAKELLYQSVEQLTDKHSWNDSRLYYLLGKAEYETHNLPIASIYTDKSIVIAQRFEDNLILLKVYKLHADIAEKVGRNATALASFKKHTLLNHENNKQQFSNDLRQIKFRLETELNERLLLERDNELLLSNVKNQKLTLYLYTVSILISFIMLAFYHRAKLNAQKRKQLNMELQVHKTKLKELDKPLVNFKHIFKDIKDNILICTDTGFLIYSNINSLQSLKDTHNTNIKELSIELNAELERSIHAGTSITAEISPLTFLQDIQNIKVTPLMDADYFIYEFHSKKSNAVDISGKITIVNRFSQSLNSLIIDKNDIGLLRPIIVDTMEMCVDTWIKMTDSNKVEFADKSKIWKVNIDEGRLRTRSLDKYLSIDTLPKQPRLKNVIKTCHFLLSQQGLTSFERDSIECYLNKTLAFDKS